MISVKLYAIFEAETRYFSSHTSHNVLQRHYIDEKVVHKVIKTFKIFND